MRIPHEIMVFVRRGEEVLVLHRTPRHEAYWHVVAGALEAGETPREAALRELREEVALGADETLLDLDRRFRYPLAGESEAVRFRFDPSVREIVVDCFVAKAPPHWEPELNDEHDEYRWCTVDEAAELLFWPEPSELVRELA
jgi:dihydroneopterin triphosphate diphosphatase